MWSNTAFVCIEAVLHLGQPNSIQKVSGGYYSASLFQHPLQLVLLPDHCKACIPLPVQRVRCGN